MFLSTSDVSKYFQYTVDVTFSFVLVKLFCYINPDKLHRTHLFGYLYPSFQTDAKHFT